MADTLTEQSLDDSIPMSERNGYREKALDIYSLIMRLEEKTNKSTNSTSMYDWIKLIVEVGKDILIPLATLKVIIKIWIESVKFEKEGTFTLTGTKQVLRWIFGMKV